MKPVHQLANLLRKRVQANRFSVRLTWVAGNAAALTYFDHKRGLFVIEIEKSLPDYAQPFYLIHEMGHVVSWDMEHPETGKEHGPAFWRAMESLYPIYESFCES